MGSAILFIVLLAEAEVDDIDKFRVFADHKIRRLDVPVKIALGVHRLYPTENLHHYLESGSDVEHVFMFFENVLELGFGYFEAAT